MTTIKIIGENARHEATIVRQSEDGEEAYGYECSFGLWCNRQRDNHNEDGTQAWVFSMEDAIKYAEAHVDRHDQGRA